ncbi:hypothetical protein EWM64_g10986 [Hericium alpestre]|uniref:LysM domain-containing protein n=1 Tax=Hericium alpestre TaxID=135208 RepID=A0A4Y9ZDY1_9AGAM|nr:hypothetical protein EWM64_g10986 [Hericium alpestre]
MKLVSLVRFLVFGTALLVASVAVQANYDRIYVVNTGDTCDSVVAQQHVPTSVALFQSFYSTVLA